MDKYFINELTTEVNTWLKQNPTIVDSITMQVADIAFMLFEVSISVMCMLGGGNPDECFETLLVNGENFSVSIDWDKILKYFIKPLMWILDQLFKLHCLIQRQMSYTQCMNPSEVHLL